MTQAEAHEYRCDECGEKFDHRVAWEQHNRTVHSRYTCEHCEEHFDQVDEFESHNFKMHPELNKFQR
jgi:predicted SprT family Zn-dependent metalloprotease